MGRAIRSPRPSPFPRAGLSKGFMASLVTTHDDPIVQNIPNDVFYGDIEFGDFQEIYRLPAATAPTTYVTQLELALDEVNEELAEWKAERELETQTVLTVEQRRYYEEAVYAWAYSLLISLLPSLYAVDQADGLEDDMEGNERRFRARAEGFLNRITGRAEPGDFTMSVI